MARKRGDRSGEVPGQLRRQRELRLSGRKMFTAFMLKCHLNNDADIIRKMRSVDNKNGYLKALIRKDIEGNG